MSSINMEETMKNSDGQGCYKNGNRRVQTDFIDIIKELEPFCYRAGIKPKEFKDCTFRELSLFIFFKKKRTFKIKSYFMKMLLYNIVKRPKKLN